MINSAVALWTQDPSYVLEWIETNYPVLWNRNICNKKHSESSNLRRA